MFDPFDRLLFTNAVARTRNLRASVPRFDNNSFCRCFMGLIASCCFTGIGRTLFSAVNVTIAALTPSIASTTFWAACRNGSSSCALSSGTVIEKNTFPSEMNISETSPSETISLSKSGPFTFFNSSITSSLVILDTNFSFLQICWIFVFPIATESLWSTG